MRPPRSNLSSRRRSRLLAAASGLLLLVLADLGLSWAGVVPPTDPRLAFLASQRTGFSPLVPDGPDAWQIRDDWVNDGEAAIDQRGEAAGRIFLLPGFRPARILRRKPPHTVRLVSLGGSTTFGLFVGAPAAFPAVLGRELSAVLSGWSVESINLGCPGWASDRLANLMPSVLELDPDLIVVYSGHNELLAGPPDEAPPAGLDPVDHLLERSATAAWIRHWSRPTRHAQALSEEDAAALAAGRAPVFDPLLVAVEDRLPPSDETLQRAAQRYAEHLAAAVRQARGRGAQVVLVQPVANLLMSPAVSAHPAGAARRQEFAELQEAAGRAFEAGDLEGALRLVEAAIAVSPRFAMTHYWRGVLLGESGRVEEARVAYRRAADLDGRTHRSTSAGERALERLAADLGVPLVDPRPDFFAELDPEAARRLFVDHCHPTAEGHRLIAARLLPVVVEQLGRLTSQTATVADGMIARPR